MGLGWFRGGLGLVLGWFKVALGLVQKLRRVDAKLGLYVGFGLVGVGVGLV